MRLPVERILDSILVLRGERVMLDADLAERGNLKFQFGISSSALKTGRSRRKEEAGGSQIRRVQIELKVLRSQIVTSKMRHDGPPIELGGKP